MYRLLQGLVTGVGLLFATGIGVLTLLGLDFAVTHLLGMHMKGVFTIPVFLVAYRLAWLLYVRLVRSVEALAAR